MNKRENILSAINVSNLSKVQDKKFNFIDWQKWLTKFSFQRKKDRYILIF